MNSFLNEIFPVVKNNSSIWIFILLVSLFIYMDRSFLFQFGYGKLSHHQLKPPLVSSTQSNQHFEVLNLQTFEGSKNFEPLNFENFEPSKFENFEPSNLENFEPSNFEDLRTFEPEPLNQLTIKWTVRSLYKSHCSNNWTTNSHTVSFPINLRSSNSIQTQNSMEESLGRNRGEQTTNQARRIPHIYWPLFDPRGSSFPPLQLVNILSVQLILVIISDIKTSE